MQYAIIAMAVGGAMSSIAGGKAAAGEAKIAAEGERQAGKDRELQRQEKIKKVLASQRAYFAGTGGDPNAGSALAIGANTQENFDIDQGTDRYNTRLRVRRYMTSASNAKRQGLYNAALSLGSGFVQYKMAGKLNT